MVDYVKTFFFFLKPLCLWSSCFLSLKSLTLKVGPFEACLQYYFTCSTRCSASSLFPVRMTSLSAELNGTFYLILDIIKLDGLLKDKTCPFILHHSQKIKLTLFTECMPISLGQGRFFGNMKLQIRRIRLNYDWISQLQFECSTLTLKYPEVDPG